MSALVDEADRSSEPSSDMSAADPDGATSDDGMAGEEAGQNGQASDGAATALAEQVDAEHDEFVDAEHAASVAAAPTPAANGHVVAGGGGADGSGEDGGGADSSGADSSGANSSGAQVVQDGPALTRADLRIDFGAHLEANYRRLVAQLYAITLDPAQAHSVVQDAYSRAWRSWATVSRTPDPTGWVRRVAVRSTMRSWRRFGLRSRRPIGPGPDTSVGAVLAALRRLPAAERRCVVLHHMAGAPLLEIAAVEGASVGTTAARLARAQQVVSAGLVDVLSDALGPEPHPLDGWAAPEWDARGLAAPARADDEEDQP